MFVFLASIERFYSSATMPASGREAHILLITGMPGVGKTTVIRAIARHLGGQPLAGFYTEEIRERGERKGFRLIGFGGEQGVIAHVDLTHTHRVGKYGVDVGAIDRLAEATLGVDVPLAVYLVDEIGKMECMSSRFVEAVRALLEVSRPVVATIASKGGGFIAEVKTRPDVLLWKITRTNRDAMRDRILAWLAALPEQGS